MPSIPENAGPSEDDGQEVGEGWEWKSEHLEGAVGGSLGSERPLWG